MSQKIFTESYLESLLISGCTERQIAAIAEMVDVTEKEIGALHLQILGMRALAHTRNDEQFAKHADTVLHSSNALVTGLREQHAALLRFLEKWKKKD